MPASKPPAATTANARNQTVGHGPGSPPPRNSGKRETRIDVAGSILTHEPCASAHVTSTNAAAATAAGTSGPSVRTYGDAPTLVLLPRPGERRGEHQQHEQAVEVREEEHHARGAQRGDAAARGARGDDHDEREPREEEARAEQEVQESPVPEAPEGEGDRREEPHAGSAGGHEQRVRSGEGRDRADRDDDAHRSSEGHHAPERGSHPVDGRIGPVQKVRRVALRETPRRIGAVEQDGDHRVVLGQVHHRQPPERHAQHGAADEGRRDEHVVYALQRHDRSLPRPPETFREERHQPPRRRHQQKGNQWVAHRRKVS